MNISNASKITIAKFIIGDNEPWLARTGRDLVHFFNNNGFRDDVYNGGLPRLNNENLNTSKKQYVENRIITIENQQILKQIFEQLITESLDEDKSIAEINSILVHDKISIRKANGTFHWEGIELQNEANNRAVFNNIQDQVISELNNARVSILVAMAWFTNETIKDKLLEKQNDGLRVEIITYRDGVNAAHGVDLTNFDHKEIRGIRGGIMHNKFCVIDNQTVLTGSYNWSTNAEFRNDENVTVSRDNKMASDYSVEFRKLKPLQ